MTPTNGIFSKTAFIASTIAIILGLFFAGHVGLVALYRQGETVTQIGFAAFIVAAIWLFSRQSANRFLALLGGTLLWAIIGEIAGHLGYVNIVAFRNIFILVLLLPVFLYLAHRKFLSDFLTIAIALFLTVWASHFVMVNLFDGLGRRHVVTMASSFLFIAVLMYSMYRMKGMRDTRGLTLSSVLVTCCSWSLLEYLWAWKTIPKPW